MSILDSDILYLYDAKLTNPNGDPDEENKPRMDDATGRNLVSDVRLKRYMRDYWLNNNTSDGDIWVRRNKDGSTTDAKGRMKDLLQEFNANGDKKLRENDAAMDENFKKWLLTQLLDVRLFGATMPMSKSSITFTGPVQFSWGYSLHRVEISSSATIASTFAGRDNNYGTFGKDWRVLYSLIGFYGIVSRHRAKHTNLKDEDIKLLDKTMLAALPAEATSRSKLGQVPRLYLRVEYKDGINAKLGDMREDIKLIVKDGDLLDNIRDMNDYNLDVSLLVARINKYRKDIKCIYLYLHHSLEATVLPQFNEVQKVLGEDCFRSL